MRIRTIHRNKLGDVYNECSAHGFEITTGDGTRITVMVDDDRSIRPAPQQPVTVDEAAAQRLANAAKADLGWSHLSPQARVEKARRYLAIAAQQPAAVDEAVVERIAAQQEVRNG